MSTQKDVRKKIERKEATNNTLMVGTKTWLYKLITSIRGRPICEDAIALNEQQRH